MTHRHSTPYENEAALTVLAVIEARLRGDQHAATILLDPWRDNLAPTLQFSVEMLAAVVRQAVVDPFAFIDIMRLDIINTMAADSQ